MTPAVVDKQVIDIDFSRGVNEAIAPQSLDWTKWLKAADNCDFGTEGLIEQRSGLWAYTGYNLDSAGASIGSVMRLLSTSNGVLAIGNGFNAYHLDESGGTTTGLSNKKTRGSEFSVTPQVVGGIMGTLGLYGTVTGPKMIGAANSTYYNVVVYTTNSEEFIVVVTDKESGNVVKSYQVSGNPASSTACMTMVGEYLHLYIGLASTSVKLYQFNLTIGSLPVAVPTAVTLTVAASIVVAAVTIGSHSYVLTSDVTITKCSTAPAEVSSGNIQGVTAFEIPPHDMATDGTSLYVVGRGGAAFKCLVKTADTSYTVTATMQDTLNDAVQVSSHFTIGVSPAGVICILAHKATVTGAYSRPTTILLGNWTGAAFPTQRVMPGVGQFSAPFWNATVGEFYAAVVDLPGAGLGLGHSKNDPASSNCVISLTGTSPYGGAIWAPEPSHCAAITDQYLDYIGNNFATTGALNASTPTSPAAPQKLFSSDSGKTIQMAAIQKIGPDSYNAELRTLRLYDVRGTVCATDTVSGGRTSSYDGLSLSEFGFVHTPTITGVAAGAGTSKTAGGLYNYILLYESVDSLGRRHISRCSNPFAYSSVGAEDVTLTIPYPSITSHRAYEIQFSGAQHNHLKYHVYRTANGGTQYYRVTSDSIDAGVIQTNPVTAETITVTDSLTDALLVANPILHRQPGTAGTPLDRYHAVASSCTVRHKDRVFFARGNTVYYSSFEVFGEAPWFNPAFSFVVPNGLGNITAMASMDGLLVVFKKNSIFIIDGDGPPENGGNGSEFSPPKKIVSESGCVDARTLINTPAGVMFRSQRGLETLRRNLTVEWTGQAMGTTLDANVYNGGAAYDPTTGRCVWIVSAAAGTYPGQLDSTAAGYAVVYNTTTNAWSRYSLRSAAGSGKAFQDVCAAEVGGTGISLAVSQRLVYADTTGIWFETGTYDKYAGTNYFIPLTLETGWARSQSKQDRIRVTDFLIAAIRNANCTLATSYAADYSPTYISVKSWAASATSALTVVQLETQPPKEAVQAMSFKVVTAAPDPVGAWAGDQFQIFGLSVRLGLRGGGVKLPSGQKG